MRPFISLCMIVKNEEKVIERCLSSVAHLVDEVILVDTGSTDNTKEIARKYTSKIYELEWIGDFSYARNFAASKATGKWILVLDADEYVDEENFKQFVDELRTDADSYNAYSVKIINFTGNDAENTVQNHHDRVYLNDGDIIYFRKIHEQFQSKTNKNLKIKTASLIIFHSGYLSHVIQEKGKLVRNKGLIEDELNKRKNDSAFDYFNLGNENMAQEKYEEALAYYVKAYQLKKDTRLSWVPTTIIQIILCLIQLKKFNEAIEIIKDGMVVYPTSPEFVYFKGEVFYRRGQLNDAKKFFHQILDNPAKYPDILLRPDLKDQMPNIRLGQIYLFEEDYNKAIQKFISVLNINRNNKDAIEKIITILVKFHSPLEISQFIKSKNLLSDKNIKMYVKAAFNNGRPELALSLVTDYKDNNNLLYKLSILKNIIIGNESNLELVTDIIDIEIMRDLNKADWINIIDLFILKQYEGESQQISNLCEALMGDLSLILLTNIMNGNEVKETIDKDFFVLSLLTLITYEKFDYVNMLLKYIDKVDQDTVVSAAGILFSKGYKAEALSIYDQADCSYFKEQDYLNIINSLVQVGNYENSIEVAQIALKEYKEDLRFYQFIFEHTEDNELFNRTYQKAKEQFIESDYLNSI